jgi:hypothetical protein
MSGSQCFENGRAIVARRCVQARDGHFVAAFLTFGAYFSIRPPHKGMKPEYGLGDNLQQIDRSIETKNVT